MTKSFIAPAALYAAIRMLIAQGMIRVQPHLYMLAEQGLAGMIGSSLAGLTANWRQRTVLHA